jgi:hypothetical protein
LWQLPGQIVPNGISGQRLGFPPQGATSAFVCFFKDRFELASDTEQRYLAAMANLGDGRVRSADAALRAGYKDRGSTSGLRESLLRKDLVYSPRRGLVDFTVPLFAGYLRSQHPLASFTDE